MSEKELIDYLDYLDDYWSVFGPKLSVPAEACCSGKKQKSRKRKRISWVQLLKRTFKIDVFKCDKCGGRLVFLPKALSETTQH